MCVLAQETNLDSESYVYIKWKKKLHKTMFILITSNVL